MPDSATVTASMLDSLVIGEISLVPSGGNQYADILARKSADDAASDATGGFLSGIKRAMTAVLAKMAPGGPSDAETHAEIDAGLADAATAMPSLGSVEKAGDAYCSPEEMAAKKKKKAAEAAAMAASESAVMSKTAPAVAGAHAVPLVPVAATGQESHTMSQTATTAPAPADIQKQIDDAVNARVAEQIAKSAELTTQNEALGARLALLEKAEKDAVLKTQFANVFASVPVTPDHAPALMTLLAKADDTERAALTSVTAFARAAADDAQLFKSVGRTRSAPATGAAAELDAIAKAAMAASGSTFHAAYAKALDLHPELAARVMASDRDQAPDNR
jgi:hypothetical protein